jgi:protease YdgD
VTRAGRAGFATHAAPAALVLLLLAASAAAQDAPRIPPSVLPGIGAGDPRQGVDVAQAPWHGLVRVQTELGGRCTGALVAPDRVLTAAHCLVAPRSRHFVQPRSVHVLLGFDRGFYAAHGRVRAFATGRYAPGSGPATEDWAMLELDRPIAGAERVLPLLRAAPPPRTAAMLGGYQQDRPEVVLADTACRIIGLERRQGGPAMLVHDCAGTRGASGAPLLARRPDGVGWGIAGVAAMTSRDIALGFAVPAAALP